MSIMPKAGNKLDEFRAVVRTNVFGNASPQHHFRQRLDHFVTSQPSGS